MRGFSAHRRLSSPHSQPPTTMPSDTDLPPSKRRRVTRACDHCKSRKRRCNGQKPCAYCTEHRTKCTYDAPYTRGKHAQHPAIPDASIAEVPEIDASSPRMAGRWPRLSLSHTAPVVVNDGDRSGVQSSRARSPVGGESAGPLGQQYLGPTSPFSVRSDL